MSLPRIVLLSTVSLLFACSKEPTTPPLTEVIVDSVVMQAYRPSGELVGRLQAFDDVEIKANVSGYLQEWTFKEGDPIEKGQLLFKIDQATYQADVAKAEAELQRMAAAVKVASLHYERGIELLPKGYISAAQMDKLTGTKLETEASLQGAVASLKRAEVNLSYTLIEAPFSGQIGSSTYSVGDLIGPDSGALTTMVNVDPMKIIFQVSESVYLGFVQRRSALAAEGIESPEIAIRLELSNGGEYPLKGKIDYISNRIDQATGTIEGRAIIANPQGLLKPGQYVKVKLEHTTTKNMLMLPQAAIQADQQGEFALVVTPEGKVSRRNVVLGARVADKVIVQQGLKLDEHVIVRGLQQVRSGQQVASKHIQSAKPTTLEDQK